MGDVAGFQKRLEGVDFVRKAFDSFDADKSGFIDPQELRAALTMLGVFSTRGVSIRWMSLSVAAIRFSEPVAENGTGSVMIAGM